VSACPRAESFACVCVKIRWFEAVKCVQMGDDEVEAAAG